MDIRSDRRVRSGARLLSAPLLAVTTIAVVVAFLVGHLAWVAAAACLALVTGFVVAVAFDRELLHARRRHAEDRAHLAQTYAERYADWRRLDRQLHGLDEQGQGGTAYQEDEANKADDVPASSVLQDRQEPHEPEPNVSVPSAAAESVVSATEPQLAGSSNGLSASPSDGTPSIANPGQPAAARRAASTAVAAGQPVAAEPDAATAEPSASAPTADSGAAPTADSGAAPKADHAVASAVPDATTTGVPGADTPCLSSPVAASEEVESGAAMSSADPTAESTAEPTAEPTTDRTAEPDLWPDLSEAPTVVDLVGWEERARERVAEQGQDQRRHA